MAKYLTVKAIYKKVGTSNFSALSSDQLKLFTSILHKTSPEIALSLMNQFKDFRMSANWMVGFLRMSVLNSKRLKRNSQREIKENCLKLLKQLDVLLSQQSISTADQAEIKNKIYMLACLISTKTKTSQKKALKVLGLVSAGALAVVGALGLLFLILAASDNSQAEESSDSDDSDFDDYDLDHLYDYLDEIPDYKLSDPNYDPYCDPDSPVYLGPFNSEIDVEDDDEDDYDESDESYAAQDYIDSRPWGLDNNGYWDENCLY